MKRAIVSALSAAALLLTAGCDTLNQISKAGTEVAVATGRMTREEADSINRVSTAVGKTFDSITPEQEHYIGRSVAATILASNRAYDNRDLNNYLNLVGQSLAQFSDRPETFGGYRFLALDAEDINAFAAPGGLILVSRGMLRCCRNEDELAAVLAHEVGHVEFRHGLQSIGKDRMTAALTVIGSEAAKKWGSQDLAELTKAFEGTIDDVTRTLVANGYGQRLERQADAAAVTILRRAGYDPHALIRMLDQMKQRLKAGGTDFGKTHPAPADRIRDIRSAVGGSAEASVPASRQQRFDRVMKGV